MRTATPNSDRRDAGELESRDPLVEEDVGREDGECGELRRQNGADRDAVAGAGCEGGDAADLAEPCDDHEW